MGYVTALQYSWFAKPMPYSAENQHHKLVKVLLRAWPLIAAQPGWDQEEGFTWFGLQQGPVTVLLWATLTQMISHSSYEISQLLFLHYSPSLLWGWVHICCSDTPACPLLKHLSCARPFLFSRSCLAECTRETLVLLSGSWHKQPLQTNGDQCSARSWREVETGGGGNLRRSLGERFHEGRRTSLSRELLIIAYVNVTLCFFCIIFLFLPILMFYITQINIRCQITMLWKETIYSEVIFTHKKSFNLQHYFLLSCSTCVRRHRIKP